MFGAQPLDINPLSQCQPEYTLLPGKKKNLWCLISLDINPTKNIALEVSLEVRITNHRALNKDSR